MHRILFSVLIGIVTLGMAVPTTHAQEDEGRFQLGGGLGFSTEGLAFTGTGNYFFRDQFSGELNFDVLGSVWGISAGGRWWLSNLAEDQKFIPYLDAAAGIYGHKSKTGFGINGGGGLDWEIDENLYLGPQGRLHIVFSDGSSSAEFAVLGMLSYRFE